MTFLSQHWHLPLSLMRVPVQGAAQNRIGLPARGVSPYKTEFSSEGCHSSGSSQSRQGMQGGVAPYNRSSASQRR